MKHTQSVTEISTLNGNQKPNSTISSPHVAKKSEDVYIRQTRRATKAIHDNTVLATNTQTHRAVILSSQKLIWDMKLPRIIVLIGHERQGTN